MHLKRMKGDLAKMKDTQCEVVKENEKGIFHSADERANKSVERAEKGCSTGDEASEDGM